MKTQKDAERTIKTMNRLWRQYRTCQEPATRIAIMNAFVKCQHFLSNRNIPYHQNPVTGRWELLDNASEV